MSDFSLEDHSNPHTFKTEPVFIFTDKAVIPAKKGPPPEAGGEKNVLPAEQSDEGTQG